MPAAREHEHGADRRGAHQERNRGDGADGRVRRSGTARAAASRAARLPPRPASRNGETTPAGHDQRGAGAGCRSRRAQAGLTPPRLREEDRQRRPNLGGVAVLEDGQEATGGPAMDVAVPEMPAVKPAPSMLPRLTGTSTVCHDSRTATSTMATAIPISRDEKTSTSQTPGGIPTAGPARRPRGWHASRCAAAPLPATGRRQPEPQRQRGRQGRLRPPPSSMQAHAQAHDGLDEGADEDGERDQCDRARRHPSRISPCGGCAGRTA